MAEGIAGCLLLGALFLYLAFRQHRRSARWHGAARLTATVESVQYREAWERKTEINDHKSSTEVTLCFSDRGRVYERRKQYSGILNTPDQGQKIPILFHRESGDWILRKEARAHWRLFLTLGCLCGAGGLALLLDGRRILSDLADYHVEAPNLAGSVVCMLIGLACGACAYACIRGLMPELIRSFAAPFLWMIRFHFQQRYEEVEALCVGIIRQELGDDDVRYCPLFRYSAGGRQLQWFPKRPMPHKRYRPGCRYTLFRDAETGQCTLRATAWDLICAVLSLIPIGFFIMLVLSLAVCAAGALCIAGAGFLSALAGGA